MESTCLIVVKLRTCNIRVRYSCICFVSWLSNMTQQQNGWLVKRYDLHLKDLGLGYGPQLVTLPSTYAFSTRSHVWKHRHVGANTPAIFTTSESINIDVKIPSKLHNYSTMVMFLIRFGHVDRHAVWTVTCVAVHRVPTVCMSHDHALKQKRRNVVILTLVPPQIK